MRLACGYYTGTGGGDDYRLSRDPETSNRKTTARVQRSGSKHRSAGTYAERNRACAGREEESGDGRLTELNKNLPFVIRRCDRSEIEPFIERWHYSKSINGVRDSYCFKLMSDGIMIGAALFGALGMAGNWKRFGEFESDVLELRRLCCIDNTPKNTESFFIGRCLRWLKQNSDAKIVVSYADPNHGHVGTIYKASNFKSLGMSPKGKMIKYDGWYYHDKAIRATYKGKPKPFAIKLKEALENGSAKYVECLGKQCYVYPLVRNKNIKQSLLVIE